MARFDHEMILKQDGNNAEKLAFFESLSDEEGKKEQWLGGDEFHSITPWVSRVSVEPVIDGLINIYCQFTDKRGHATVSRQTAREIAARLIQYADEADRVAGEAVGESFNG